MTPKKQVPSTLHFDFESRRALVTSAGKGIGREIARMFYLFNVRVIALSRTETDLASLREEIGCEIMTADLADAE